MNARVIASFQRRRATAPAHYLARAEIRSHPMKVSSRITLGYGILLAAILLLAAVQISAIRRLQDLIEGTARSGLSAAMTSLELMQDAELIGEYAGRFFREGDPEARKQIDSLRDTFQADLQQLTASTRSKSEDKDAERLSEFWKQFLGNLGRAQSVSRPGEIPPDLAEDLDRLRTQTRTLYQASLRSIEAQAEESRVIARRTERVSWVLAAGVVVAGGLLSLLIVRSVSIPLTNLAEGTRSMAEGGSYYRLDTSRSDEIAQIAKDFNTVAERLKSAPRHD
jgi:two-component system, NtrC family, sensor histidine kinase KinB